MTLSNASRHSRKAFTLIELMVVMFVILILIGLFFAGMTHWRATADRHATAVRMEIMNSWLADLQASAPQTFNTLFVNPNPPYNVLDVSGSGSITTDSTAYRNTVINYMCVPAGGGSSAGIMSFLIKQPDVAKSLANLPANALTPGVASSSGPAPSVVLDGWGNPIVYVPATGIKYNTGLIVTAPDNRPFWVSAGPDGNLDTPADNIYSFEQQP